MDYSAISFKTWATSAYPIFEDNRPFTGIGSLGRIVAPQVNCELMMCVRKRHQVRGYQEKTRRRRG